MEMIKSAICKYEKFQMKVDSLFQLKRMSKYLLQVFTKKIWFSDYEIDLYSIES